MLKLNEIKCDDPRVQREVEFFNVEIRNHNESVMYEDVISAKVPWWKRLLTFITFGLYN
jgi:hypothetical protein